MSWQTATTPEALVLLVEDEIEEQLDREGRAVETVVLALAAQALQPREVAEVEILEIGRQVLGELAPDDFLAAGAVHVGERRVGPQHGEIAVGDRDAHLRGLERLLELAQALARLADLREVADQHQDALAGAGERGDLDDADRKGGAVLAVGLERAQARSVARRCPAADRWFRKR